MTTKLFGTTVQRVEDQRFLRGQGRYVDDVAVGPDAPARRGAALAARPRAGRSTSTSTTCSTSRACTRSGPTRTSPTCRADGRAAAAADPAPDADPRPHAVRAGQRRGQLRRRGDRVRGRRRPLRRRGRRRPDPGRLRGAAARWSASRRPGPRRRSCTTTCRATSAPGWSRRTATPAAAIAAAPHTLDPRPDRRAQRLPADGGPRHRRPLGPRRRPADGVVVDPDLDRRARRRSPSSSASTSARST